MVPTSRTLLPCSSVGRQLRQISIKFLLMIRYLFQLYINNALDLLTMRFCARLRRSPEATTTTTTSTFQPSRFSDAGPGDECNWESELRGLIPRTLKYLYRRLDSLKAEFGEKVHFTVNCTLLEIYNEQVIYNEQLISTSGCC